MSVNGVDLSAANRAQEAQRIERLADATRREDQARARRTEANAHVEAKAAQRREADEARGNQLDVET